MSEEVIIDPDISAEFFATRARLKKAFVLVDYLIEHRIRADNLIGIDDESWGIVARACSVKPPSEITKLIVKELLAWRWK